MDTRLSLGKPAKALRCKLVAGPRQPTTVQGGKKISEQVMVGESYTSSEDVSPSVGTSQKTSKPNSVGCY